MSLSPSLDQADPACAPSIDPRRMNRDADGGMTVIRVHEVAKRYGRLPAVSGMSWTIAGSMAFGCGDHSAWKQCVRFWTFAISPTVPVNFVYNRWTP